MSGGFLLDFKKFITDHKGGKSAKRRHVRKASGKKPPSSLSIFPDKSPQLQKWGEPTKLNQFTTKNVSLRDNNNNEYNAIINGRLAYRRAPRGQDIQDDADIIYGPSVEQVNSNTYKKLKKDDRLYYDRGSVVMRGPFIFIGVRRGPELLLKVKDAVYDKEYLFIISIKDLKDEKLYMIKGKIPTRKAHHKNKSKQKTHKNKSNRKKYRNAHKNKNKSNRKKDRNAHKNKNKSNRKKTEMRIKNKSNRKK